MLELSHIYKDSTVQLTLLSIILCWKVSLIKLRLTTYVELLEEFNRLIPVLQPQMVVNAPDSITVYSSDTPMTWYACKVINHDLDDLQKMRCDDLTYIEVENIYYYITLDHPFLDSQTLDDKVLKLVRIPNTKITLPVHWVRRCPQLIGITWTSASILMGLSWEMGMLSHNYEHHQRDSQGTHCCLFKKTKLDSYTVHEGGLTCHSSMDVVLTTLGSETTPCTNSFQSSLG